MSFDFLDFYHRRVTLFGVDTRALTVADCARLLGAMSPMFEAGRLQPSAVAKHGTLLDALELYSFVDKGGAGKAVFAFG